MSAFLDLLAILGGLVCIAVVVDADTADSLSLGAHRSRTAALGRVTSRTAGLITPPPQSDARSAASNVDRAPNLPGNPCEECGRIGARYRRLVGYRVCDLCEAEMAAEAEHHRISHY